MAYRVGRRVLDIAGKDNYVTESRFEFLKVLILMLRSCNTNPQMTNMDRLLCYLGLVTILPSTYFNFIK